MRHGCASIVKNVENPPDLKTGFIQAPKPPIKTTTKAILTLLQILLHIPSIRSIGLAES